METLDCIKSRRSKRLFLDKEVSDELINSILESAIIAPSSVDCQPWHFIIVKDKDKKQKLAELKSEDNQQHILTAPISIVVCVDKNKSPSRYAEDGVCATQNILLSAHSLGLGSVYVTGFKPSKPEIEDKVREILSLPEHIIPITILPIGYPDPNEKLDDKTLINIKDVTHYDKW